LRTARRQTRPSLARSPAVFKRGGLQAPGRLSLHSLRHGFASLLIAEGAERRLRLPPARSRQSNDHARRLRAPVRAGRPRRRGAGGAGGQLYGGS